MIGSTAGTPNDTMPANFAYAARANYILAILFLIAFFALRASHPEVGTSLGQRPCRVARDRVHGPGCAVRMVARPTLEPDHPGDGRFCNGGPRGWRSAACALGACVRGPCTERDGCLDAPVSVVALHQPTVAPVGRPRTWRCTARGIPGSRDVGRWRGRRARVVALDVVAAALAAITMLGTPFWFLLLGRHLGES